MSMRLLKTATLIVATAVSAIAGDPVTCTRNDTQDIRKAQHITASITDGDNFCTMLTGYGVKNVASNEGCGEAYCQGKIVAGGHPMPPGYILSSNFEKTEHYTQITGCINSAVWAQDPLDDGGQMDSHGWPYSCVGYAKFVSLIEPATNTFCIRCCDKDDNADCNTSQSARGCPVVIPGRYEMSDGSPCKTPREIQQQQA